MGNATRIYFDNAATTPMFPKVCAELAEAMDTFGNPSSIHSYGRMARWKIEESRKKVAQILQAHSSEIFFTSGATESINTVIQGCVMGGLCRYIITSPLEHSATLENIRFIQKYFPEITLRFLGVDAQGHINYDELAAYLKESKEQRSPALVSLLYINNEIGTILDVARVGDLVRSYGALLHLDAVQAIGHIPVNLQMLQVDFLSASGHKFHAPKGIGLLFVRSGIMLPPLIYGGAQERNMRGGTENIWGIIGLASALEEVYTHLAADKAHIFALKEALWKGLHTLYGSRVQVLGDAWDKSLYSLINIGFQKNAATDMLAINLDIQGVCISGGSACSSGAEKASHVISGIGKEDRVALRFSFSKFNTLSEVATALRIFNNILSFLCLFILMHLF